VQVHLIQIGDFKVYIALIKAKKGNVLEMVKLVKFEHLDKLYILFGIFLSILEELSHIPKYECFGPSMS
jgi:hypothetical protein